MKANKPSSTTVLATLTSTLFALAVTSQAALVTLPITNSVWFFRLN